MSKNVDEGIVKEVEKRSIGGWEKRRDVEILEKRRKVIMK